MRTGAGRVSVVQWCAAAVLCLVLAAGLPQAVITAAQPAWGTEQTVVPGGVLNPGLMVAMASESRVYDYAGLFDRSETADLEDAVAAARDEVDFDIAVMTTDDAEGKSAQDFADDAYEEMELGEGRDHSGILYLIDMDNREIYISTEGEAIRIFTDQRIETMLDHAYEAVSDGYYAESAESFLEDAVYYGRQGIVSGQYNYDEDTGRVSVHRRISVSEFLLALGVALIVAGGAAATVKRQYNMEEDPRQIANLNMAYRADSQIQVADHADRLLSTFVVTAAIATAAARSAGSSHSSGSSSHRSTTHHSSSGRSHGGGGRRF